MTLIPEPSLVMLKVDRTKSLFSTAPWYNSTYEMSSLSGTRFVTEMLCETILDLGFVIITLDKAITISRTGLCYNNPRQGINQWLHWAFLIILLNKTKPFAESDFAVITLDGLFQEPGIVLMTRNTAYLNSRTDLCHNATEYGNIQFWNKTFIIM